MCGEVCECWYDHDHPVSGATLCALLTQDKKLNDACHYGRLEEARSAVVRGGNPNWKDWVSFHLVHSHCV